MTQRKDTAPAHPVAPNKWARIRQAERVTYAGAVAAPPRIDWRTGPAGRLTAKIQAVEDHLAQD